MNGEQDGPNLNEFNPSWIEDGGGIIGEQSDSSFDNQLQWDTTAWSRDNQQQSDASGAGPCNPSAPPASGTHIWGSIGGVCQWIDTTTCS